MARSPKRAAEIVFGRADRKQFPDPEGLEREKPSSAIEGQTQPIGGDRKRPVYSEQVSEIGMETRHKEDAARKGMRYTFRDRSNKRPKHLQHPAPVANSPYKPQHQMERPHYEEAEMTNKTYRDFVTEAKRGRPRKLRPGEQADTEHIQDQLSKLTHPNHVEVHFKDGSKHKIPREHANAALHHLASLKPIHRAEHAEHMGKSHHDFYHVLSKKSVPEKKGKITLAGPKLRKEEADHDDDGWYAHKEMHGSKAISKEDWKKGVRPKKTMKKEETEQIDELSLGTMAGYAAKSAGSAAKAAGSMALDSVKKAGSALAKMIPGTGGKPEDKEAPQSDADDKQDKAQQTLKKRMAGFKMMSQKAKKSAASKLRGEEVEQIDEWGNKSKAITGPHAKTSAMGIAPPKVGYKGKGTKPKAQKLSTEDYAPLEKGEGQTHPDEKTLDAKSRKQGAEKPKKPKLQLSQEEWELYDSLSDEHKTIFEKMDREELDKMMASWGGKIKKGKYNQPRESEKPWPRSKMKGSKWASTAGSINRKNQGFKK